MIKPAGCDVNRHANDGGEGAVSCNHASPGETLEPQTDYEALLMERIDEKVLRKVFSGICRS
jgi:hypothetical protein